MQIIEIVLILSLLAGGVIAWLMLKDRFALLRQLADLRENSGKWNAELLAKQQRIDCLEREVEQLAAGRDALAAEKAGFHEHIAGLREHSAKLATEVSTRQEQIQRLERMTMELTDERNALNKDLMLSKTAIATLTEALEAERNQAQEKLALLDHAKQQLSDQFKALAGEILDEKSRKFTEQNQTNLGQLLHPLKQQLTDFKTKVEEVYVNEGKDRSALTEQVKHLMALNQTLSQDANNLTLALKGDRKAQGNWGEIILDDVLERAGLLRGQHYERQGNIKSEDGVSHVIPDVIVKLPGERRLVIDSKLTLPDYRVFASADNDDERATALKRHLVSIHNHIKGLSEKNYHALYGLQSLDFVIMFIPLEPAFITCVTHDRELFERAWNKNVLLVSPSTLLFVIRTVAYLWRQEGLSRNAKEISSRGAELYDRLQGFVEEMNKVGNALEVARNSFDEAKKKLSSGKGNVIRQAELLKNLGVKPSKQLNPRWVEPAIDEPLLVSVDETDITKF